MAASTTYNLQCRERTGKRWWAVLLLSIFTFQFSQAQTNFNAAEYFFDSDPGVGSGTSIPVTLTPDSIAVSFNPSVTGLLPGEHMLYVRSRTQNIKWSIYERQRFFIKPTIVAAECFFDIDPGAGNGTNIPITSSLDSVTVTAAVTIPALTGGLHFMYIRTRDDLGRWSIAEFKPFVVNSSSTISAAEWFVDTDPGVGNGTAISFASAQDSVTVNAAINLPVLQGGIHFLYIRTKTQDGRWSHYEFKPFFINSGSTIDYAEFFVDTDPGIGNGVAISFAPGVDSVTVNTTLTVPLNTTPGTHYVFIRTRSTSGKWSIYEGKRIDVRNSIVAAEYFYDVDPGAGNGTPLSVTATPDSIIVNATGVSVACLDSGTHYLWIRTKDAAGRWSVYEHDTLFINQPAPQISASGPSTICAGDSTTLTANTGAGCNYQWYLNNVSIPSATGQTYVATTGGDYKLVMTTNAVAYTSNTITITLGGGGPAPTISPSGPTTFCNGGSVDLTALPNTSTAFLWSTGSTNQTITVTTDGNYFCTVTDNTGCNAPVSITITVNPNPTPNISPATATICNGNSILLTASGGSSYSWSNGTSTAGNTVSPTVATTYTVTVTAANSCTASASRLVNVNSLPTVTASNTGPYCIGETIQLNAGGAVSYVWSGVNSFNSTQQNPTCAATVANGGVYNVTGTDANSCSASATTSVVVNGSTASITPSGPTTFCAGGSVDLDASAGQSWSWSTGASSQSITVTSSANYSVTVTDVSSCTSSASVNVSVLSNPTASAGHSNPVCENGNVTLTSSGGSLYNWSGPSFTSGVQNPVITGLNAGTHDGTYTVTVTAGNGCTASATTSIAVNANPVAVASNTGPYCVGETIQLNSSGGATYHWNGVNSFNNNNQNPARSATAINAGDYFVTVTDANGCTDSASITVVVNVATASITPSGATTFCAGGSVDLTANAGTSYAWSNGATSQTITVTTQGNYRVTVTQANGCSASVLQNVTVNPNPTVNANNTGPYCIGYNIQLNSNGTNINTYSWSGPNSFVSAAQNPTIASTTSNNFGTYHVTVTSAAGCTATATTVVSSTGNAPVLSYSGSANFTSHIVDPLQASPYTNFRFEVKYTDADGNMPAANYPRVIMDYEGNGSFVDANDRLFIMQQADPNDNNVVDGKIYFYVATGLPVGLNYQTRIVANDNSASSCTNTFGPFAEPDVLDDADIFIFANDIVFDDPAPDTSQALQVCATIHNESDYPAINFVVHLRNQYDTLASYGDITVPFLAAHSTTTVCWNIVTPSTPSWNPMQVVIDYNNVINEPNELDNQAIRPFVCGNFILPGRIKLTANVNPQTSYAVSGNWLSVSGRATYEGTAVPLQDPSVAGATVTLFVPSTGATYSTYTNSGGYYGLNFLAPVTPGVYDVEVSVTDFTLDGDTTAPFALNPPPCAADLSPYLTLPNYTIVAGQSITGGTFQVSNVGCANVNINTLTTWTCTGATTSSGSAATSTPFNSGTTQNFSFPVFTFPTAGNYNVCVNADAGNSVAETNENNSFCRGISVLPACADLAAGVVTLNSSYQQCTPASFTFGVSNPGGYAVGTTSYARLVIKNPGGVIEAVYSNVIPALGAQAGTSFGYTHSFATTGTYQLMFTVDTTAVVTECDETNNAVVTSTSSYTCVYKPDLYVQGCGSFDITPVNPLSSPTIGVTAVVSNGGNATAVGPFVVRFNVAGTIYNHTHAGNLAAGASSSITINVPTPLAPGGSLFVTADVNNNVTGEWSETNNTSSESTCHDYSLGNDCLNIIGNDFWEQGHILNQPFNMGVYLYSNALYKASTVKTRFEISGPGLPVGWNDLGFATNNNVNRTCGCPYYAALPTPFACPATGTYSVRMTADYDNSYNECNEGNNVMIVSFVCTNLPDYRTLSQYIAPSLLNPEPNQPVDIDISYDNIGASNIGDSLEIKLLVDEVPVDSARDRTLAYMDHWTTRMPNQWSSPIVGVHILRAIVDSDNEILEGNEGGNNEATRAIIVGQSPNLLFAEITPSNPAPSVGDVITFTVTIGNQGDQDAVSDIIFKYVNDLGDTIQIYALNDGNFPNNDSTTFTFNWAVADASTFIFGYIVNTAPGEYLYDDNSAWTQLGALSLNFASTQESCIDYNNGTLTTHVSGGVPPYSFIWSNGGADSIITAGNGSYTVTVVDFEGNIGTGGGTITTTPDITNPIIGNVPTNITYNATNGVCPAAITWSAPVASDNCGIDSFYSNKQPGDLFNAGTTTVTYVAKDKAGRTTTASFTVTVVGLPLSYAGADATICGSGTLNALPAQWGTGIWSVANGSASFANANSEVSPVNNLYGGVNKLVWTITNGSCGSTTDTVSITQPVEICGNGLDDDCDGTADDGCAPTTPVWNGSVDSNWNNPLNWTPNVVPNGCAMNVIIPNLPIDPVINIPVSIGDVTINANAHLTINSTLSVCGDWLGGVGASALVDGTGELILNGSTSQTVSGRTRIDQFVLNNVTGVALQAGSTLEIFEELALQIGELNTTSGTLRLLSTAANHCAIINDFGSNTGTLNGNITAQRFVAGTVNDQQHQIGIPVQANLSALGAGAGGGFFISTVDCNEVQPAAGSPDGKVYQWHEERPNSIPALDCILDGWEIKTGATPADKGRAYSVKINPNTTLNVTGVPNLSGTAVAVTNLGNQGYNLPTLQSSPNYTFDAGWHLLTNPYPSGYTYQQEPGFNALAFVYIPTGAFSGSYQPLTPGSVLAPFQGFMVQRTASGNATFNFHNAQRNTNGNSNFYQINNAETLNIEISGNGFMDATDLSFNVNSTNTFDADYDLRKQRSDLGQPTLFTGNHTFPYAVNNLTGIQQTSTVEMGVIPGAPGNYTITINGISSFDPTSYIYLEDKVTGTLQNVRTNNTYTFSMTTTESVDRFVLHFTPKAELSSTNSSCAGQGQINIEQPGTANWSYTVVDHNTTTIATGTLNQNSPIQLSVAAGVYTVTLIDNNGYTVVKQMQVTGASPITANFSSSKQTAEEGEQINFTVTTPSAINTTWSMGDGTTYTTANATHQYQSEGSYTVTLTVTNADGCTDTKTQVITVTAKEEVVSGISHLTDKNGIAMWSHGKKVYIDFSKQKSVEASIEIYNILGQQLVNEKFGKASIYSKDLQNLEAAYVIVKVLNNGELITKKLFVAEGK